MVRVRVFMTSQNSGSFGNTKIYPKIGEYLNIASIMKKNTKTTSNLEVINCK